MIWKIGLTIIACIIWFGFIGPWTVSSASGIAVVAWFLATAVIILFVGNKIHKQYKQRSGA